VDDNGKYIVIIYIRSQSTTVVRWLIIGIVCLISGNKKTMSICKMLQFSLSQTLHSFYIILDW